MIEELIVTLVTGLPNLAVALYALWKADQRVDRLTGLLERMVEQNYQLSIQVKSKQDSFQ